ncbi:unnamed protein product [Dovyalis caffra]|uniref:Uncharacterized protein n=1 Tax=Dovyalis caffra TaxID=77055 RepID=A0AAV1QUN2_9ROSI|nr:unnamed protein product [Dovyalis caffra]
MYVPVSPQTPMCFPLNPQTPMFVLVPQTPINVLPPANPPTPMYVPWPTNPPTPMYVLEPANPQTTMYPPTSMNEQSTPEITIKEIQLNSHGKRPNVTREPLLDVAFSLALVSTGTSGTAPTTPADILQLCVGNLCLTFQLSQADTVPNNLQRFLLRPRNTFVGIWNSLDKHCLANSKHHLQVSGRVFDLSFRAKDDNGKSLRFESKYRIRQQCLGLPRRFADLRNNDHHWNAANLSLNQIMHACVDVYASCVLGMKVHAYDFERVSS